MTKFIQRILLGCSFLLILVGCKSYTLQAGLEKRTNGEYFESLDILKRAVPKVPSKDRQARAEALLILAEAQYIMGQYSQADVTCNTLLRLKIELPQLNLTVAKIKHQLGRHAEAAKYYKQHLVVDPNSFEATNGLTSCTQAPEWIKNPTKIQVRTSIIQSNRYSEFSPSVGGNGSGILALTTYSTKNQGRKNNPVTGQRYGDLLERRSDDRGRWGKPQYLKELNSEFEEGNPSITADGMRLYFVRISPDTKDKVQFFVSTRSGTEWGKPQEIKLMKDTTALITHPAVSPDGSIVMFAAQTRVGGYGKWDLYMGKLSGTNVEGVEPLSAQINTRADEVFPYPRSDSEFYFSSNGHPTLGGLDIFKAVKDNDGNWIVQNMGTPINSAGDDHGITFAGLEEKGYFSSNRANPKTGVDQLYSFVNPATPYFIEGVVVDEINRPIVEANLRVISDRGRSERLKAGTDGKFKVKGDRGASFLIQSLADGYLNAYTEVQFKDEDKEQTYYIKNVLFPVSRPIRVDNVFFDVAKADLRSESEKSLQGVVEVLNNNPNITIELSAHTDRAGADDYNMTLSQARAQSVVNYLVEKGIDPERLTPKGYGKSDPKTVDELMAKQHNFLKEGDVLSEEMIGKLNKAQQDVCDQINRRTEFRVLKTNFRLY